MKLRLAIIEVSLDLAAGVIVTFAEQIEVSLDCPVCRRLMRTVFVGPEGRACCTPSGHDLEARAEILERGEHAVRYRLSYPYEPFFDEKDEMDSSDPLSWARVSFEVTCAGCGVTSGMAVQSNSERPWDELCLCGALLYREADEQPVIRRLDAEGNPV